MQDAYNEDRRRLEIAYRASLSVSQQLDISDVSIGREASIPASRLEQLPIWTGTANTIEVMLPGQQTWLHVEEPRHCQLFEELLDRGEPHIFGAIVLEDNQEESDLEFTSGNVGTLMDVASYKRLSGGHFLLQVLGVCRIRMDACGKARPYVRAVCVVLPDEEEVQFQLPTGTGQVMASLRKREALSQDVLATLEDGYFQRASLLVARHAAAAWSLSWRGYETPIHVTAQHSSENILAEIASLNLGVHPEDTQFLAQSAATQAALLYTPEALRLVGYRPMMREYLGGGILGGGLDTEELMPPSWLEVIDHYAARTGAEDANSINATSAVGEEKTEEEEKEEGEEEGKGQEGKDTLTRVGGGQAKNGVELKEGGLTGGKWGGQIHGRGAELVEATLVQQELKIWGLLQQIATVRLELGDSYVYAQEGDGGRQGDGQMGGGEGEGGGGGLPAGLRHIHPAVAHPAWPTVRRVQVCCSVLQCVAVRCSALQCVAVCCSALQCVAVCCTVLQCGAVCCSSLKCVAVCCRSLQCAAVCCSVLQCVTVYCSALQCVAVCCSALQCVAVWCTVLQCVAVCCSSLKCVAVCCSVLQFDTVCCSVLHCVAVCCSVLQCVTVYCSALQCVAVRRVW